MKSLPYISPKLDVRIRPDSKDEGLKETAEFYLATPIEECDISYRDFGVIVKKPNYFQKVMPRMYCFGNHLSAASVDSRIYDYEFGTTESDDRLVLDRHKQYVLSEIFLCLFPEASTVMMSHEGELFELVEVVGPGEMKLITGQPDGTKNQYIPRYLAGSSFFSVEPKINFLPSNFSNLGNETLFGFYHQLHNPDTDALELAHILMIAEKGMAMKDGNPMKYGINRPPNTWKGSN